MPATAPPRITGIDEFLHARLKDLLQVDDNISYLAEPPMPEEDLRHYIQDPVAALPPKIREQLPPIANFLLPYLLGAQPGTAGSIGFDKVIPERAIPAFRVKAANGRTLLFFATEEEEVSEFHFTFYNTVAELIAEVWTKDAASAFAGLVREEIAAKVHGEIDEKSWHLKQGLPAKGPLKDGRPFREYARQAFIDTMTLYLHGICCDIDVETGPRQLPSRSVRKRLELLRQLYPPPSGLAVFPEELSKTRSPK